MVEEQVDEVCEVMHTTVPTTTIHSTHVVFRVQWYNMDSTYSTAKTLRAGRGLARVECSHAEVMFAMSISHVHHLVLVLVRQHTPTLTTLPTHASHPPSILIVKLPLRNALASPRPR